MHFILNSLNEIIPHLKNGQVLSLESTTYPGTTEEVIRPKIESQGFKIGKNFFIGYSPERIDPGNNEFKTDTIPKVISGSTDECSMVIKALYKTIVKEVVLVSSTKVAEMSKLLENIYRAVNIGLINELKPLAIKMDIDIFEVIQAASSKPFGFLPYFPGPGLGGHCLPIDPFYLTWKAREYGMHTRFIELAGEINTYMPTYVVERTNEALNMRTKSIKGSKLLILGITYKKNVDDTRESPAIEIINLLRKKGSFVDYSDPYFSKFPSNRKLKLNLESKDINKENLKKYDAVILITDHDNFDYEFIYKHSEIIIDTRGRYSSKSKIIRA